MTKCILRTVLTIALVIPPETDNPIIKALSYCLTPWYGCPLRIALRDAGIEPPSRWVRMHQRLAAEGK